MKVDGKCHVNLIQFLYFDEHKMHQYTIIIIYKMIK